MTEHKDYLPPAKSALPKNKGGRPRNKIDATSPDFVAAVNQATQAAMMSAMPAMIAQVTQHILSVRGLSATDQLPSGDTDVINRVAVAIAEMNDANTGRKRLSPAEIQKRDLAMQRLIKLVVEVQTTDFDHPSAPEAPHYRIVAKTFLTDFVVEPFEVDPNTKAMIPVTKHWTGIPNEAMVPINQSAQDIFAAYMEAIGGPTDLTSNADTREMSVTPGGFVVKGLNVSARRTVGSLLPGSTTDVMGVRNQNDPRSPKVNVLGTIAAAAVANDGPNKFSAGALT